jgi:hypothetical protein
MPKPPEVLQAKARYKSMSMQKAKEDKDKAGSTAKEKRLNLKLIDTNNAEVNINDNIFKTNKYVPKEAISSILTNTIIPNIAKLTDNGNINGFLSQKITLHGPNLARKVETTIPKLLGPAVDLIRDSVLIDKKADGSKNNLIVRDAAGNAVKDANGNNIAKQPNVNLISEGVSERENKMFNLYHDILKGDLLEINEGTDNNGKRYYNVGLGAKFSKGTLIDKMNGASLIEVKPELKRSADGKITEQSLGYKLDDNVVNLENLFSQIIEFTLGKDPENLTNIISRANAGDVYELAPESERRAAFYRAASLSMLKDFFPTDLSPFDRYANHQLNKAITSNTSEEKLKNFSMGAIDSKQMDILDGAGILGELTTIDPITKKPVASSYGYDRTSPALSAPNTQTLSAVKMLYDQAPTNKGKKQVAPWVQKFYNTYLAPVYDTTNSTYEPIRQNIAKIQASGYRSLLQLTAPNNNLELPDK